MITVLRESAVAGIVVISITLQVSIFSHFALGGVAPDLALLVVIAAALVRGPEYAAVVGFGAGLLLDLAPPADHTAGRWALSLVLVGYLTGLAKSDGDSTVIGRVLMVAAGAFIGTSVFALTGLILRDQGVSVGAALDVVPRAVVYDVLITPLVLPLLLLAMRRLHPPARRYQRAGSERRLVPHRAEQW